MNPENDPGISKELTAMAQDDGNPEVRLVTRPDHSNEDDAEAARIREQREFMSWFGKKWRIAKDGESLQRTRSLEEERFNSGDHWDASDRRARDEEDRPVIEINRTPQFLNQVGNEMRMTRPQITVKATGDKADKKTAGIKNGLIRSIQKRSGAERIRDDAFYGVLVKGWAHWRVNIEWESDRSPRQVLRTGRIANDFSVYTDPASVEHDKSDANFRIITQDMATDQYKLDYPDSQLASMTNYTTLGDDLKDWVSDKVQRVAEFWYRERKKDKLYFLADDLLGDGKFEDELKKDAVGNLLGVARDERGQYMWRWSWRTKIKWAKVNAVEILDGNEDKTAGREYIQGAKYIPIITALGRRIYIENKYIYAGMVRDAIAPCLASDYWLSALTEMVALGPKAPWIVAWEAVKQHQEMWDTANVRNFGALYYDHKDANGNEVPKPFRNFGEAPIQSMTFILRFADDDLKRVMGIYSAGLGAPGPESSGVAINSRKVESDVANFNYIDNFKTPMEYEAKVYLDLIPKVYNEEQMVEIVRDDNKTSERVKINAPTEHNGEKVKYMMGDGYDAEVEIGPSYTTKRQEAVAAMTEFVKADPTVAPLVDDLIAANMDFPNSEEFVKRLRSRVPPNLLSAEDGGDLKVPPQFQAQYDAQAKQVEQLTQLLQQLQDKMESEDRKFQHERDMESMKLATEERIATANADQKAFAADIAAKSKATSDMISAALANYQRDIDDLRESVKSLKPDNAADKPAAQQMA